MDKNIGKTDMMLRVVVGLALIASALSGVFTPWGWVGVVPLATGLLRWCPAYTIFGLKTCGSCCCGSGGCGSKGDKAA